MSAVGWVGLGKLGLPCALVLADVGHDVLGYDVDNEKVSARLDSATDQGEAGMGELISRTRLRLADDIPSVVKHADVVFVAVQTPHAPAYSGETPAPETRSDFEYAYLVDACRAVCRAANAAEKDVTLVVVSTVLPGTCDRLIRPLLGAHVRLIYNPFFIAMGTTVADFRDPEFVLVGMDGWAGFEAFREVYAEVVGPAKRLVHMSIPSAELTKVSYNTFISMKIVFANMLMEICHGTGADVDDVTDALALATDRVVSPKYLRAGMGDGGACHPRDLIAMSWLAERLDLSYDLLGEMVEAREAQTEWLAELVGSWCDRTGLEPFVLGKAYKLGSPLTYGSPALLLGEMLGAESYDPFIDGWPEKGWPTALAKSAVFVIGTQHGEWPTCVFPSGSVVIDPWGYMPDQPGITVVRVGRKR